MKRIQILLIAILIGICLSSCSSLNESPSSVPLIVDHTNWDPGILTDKQVAGVQNLDIYFQHASVGENVCGGLADLNTSTRYVVNRTHGSTDSTGVPDSWFDNNNGFADLWRGNPGASQKVQIFYNYLHGKILSTKLDVATWKFCYIDSPGDDAAAQALFDETRQAMDTLEAEYPLVTFIWWTMPIETTANASRQTYNDLVRAHCKNHKKWLLDIAALESHDDSGAPRVDGSGIELMVAAYTGDGGHLNTAGSGKVARALWRLLGQVTDRQ